MKLFLMIALAIGILSGAAGASQVGPNSSWEEIRQAGLIPGFPTIFFGTNGVTVDELCIDGDNLRPIQPNRSTCVEFDRKFNCIRYEIRYLSTPRVHNESRCVKWNTKGDDCEIYENFPVVYPSTYKVTVYAEHPRTGLVPAFSKSFEIPACE